MHALCKVRKATLVQYSLDRHPGPLSWDPLVDLRCNKNRNFDLMPAAKCGVEKITPVIYMSSQ